MRKAHNREIQPQVLAAKAKVLLREVQKKKIGGGKAPAFEVEAVVKRGNNCPHARKWPGCELMCRRGKLVKREDRQNAEGDEEVGSYKSMFKRVDTNTR